MSVHEIALWCLVLGVYLTCLTLSITHSVVARNSAGWQAAGFVLVAGLFVASVIGLLHSLLPAAWHPYLDLLRLVSGPISAASGAYLLAEFLRARRRDSVVQFGLMGLVALSLSLCLLILMPDRVLAMHLVAYGVIACALFAMALVVRAALLGDKMAWYMAAASLTMCLAVAGIYALALGQLRNSLGWHVAIALQTTLYLMGTTLTIRQRNMQFLRMDRALNYDPSRDLLTQLITGPALVTQVNACIRRAKRSRKEVAIVCVEIYNTSKLRKEFGAHALEEVIYTLAARVNKAAGAVTQVGRFTDTSFVVVLDSLKHVKQLRTVGLRLASSARKPYALHPYSTEARDFRADIGVGIARVAPAHASARHDQTSFDQSSNSSTAEEALHEAADLAAWSRSIASRCAILDGASGQQVPIEKATFHA